MKSFAEQCYHALRLVPLGSVTTYKDIAEYLGTKAYRAVGSAMNKNPYPKDQVPCHRVVNSGGKLGGYAFGTEKKIAMLAAEGVAVRDGAVVNYKEIHFTYKELHTLNT